MNYTRLEPLIASRAVSGTDQLAVVTTYMGAESIRERAFGFLELAEIATASPVSIDSVVPSVIYSVRHSVELFLKYLIMKHSERLTGQPVSKRGHSLEKLLKQARCLYGPILEDERSHDYHNSEFVLSEWDKLLEHIVSELHGIDPSGTELRYTTTKRKGESETANQNKGFVASIDQMRRFMTQVRTCYEHYRHRNT